MKPVLIHKKVLMKHRIVQVQHFPYSLDTEPDNFFLFPKLKIYLKTKMCGSVGH